MNVVSSKSFICKVLHMHKSPLHKLHIVLIVMLVFWFIARQNFVTADRTKLQVNKSDFVSLLINSSESIIIDNKNWSIAKFDNDFDLLSQNSYQRYVSDENRVDIHYIPHDLEPIKNDFIIDNASTSLLRNNANNALHILSKEFFSHFGKKLYLFSAYRSSSYQRYLVNQGCKRDLCARPGGSEHQLGLAVDIHISPERWWVINMWGEYYDWMKDNAYKYWFINTYQKWCKIDGKVAEPRHRRYVWVAFATYLYENNLTIAEYFHQKTI